MVQVLTLNPYEIDYKMDLEEGDITVQLAEADFGQDTVAVFSNPMQKGDYVTIAGDGKVKKAGASDPVYGQLIDRPAWNKERPTESKTSGNYTPRIGTIRFNCDYIHAVPLVAANQAIDAGDKIKYQGDNKFDKGEGNGISLNKKEANVGGKVTCMFGVRLM